ncbi:SOS response-associated peptidase [Roseivivax isoporae]|uniref:Abasic site processing protein n=1 Tax=Roseivivax isoporae LMG 25204 TaxID=1449351 RepID=X7FCU4_9RHOB|nr:SOS response-associated peptidase [Roseivivax isoporae]ETX29916.1 hypothetical protein RISW2_19905 [Roseivivax isoporae LMG 25204]
MPGRLFLTRPLAEVAQAAGMAPPAGGPDDGPRPNIAPGQEVTALTAGGFRRMRWGLIPQGRRNARGRPVMETLVNARSETLFDKTAFAGLHRAAVPVDGWYEWTGARGRKTAWAIRDSGGDTLWMAAVWDVWQAPGGVEVAQFATVTCAPNADIAPVHERMGVILTRDCVDAWIAGAEEEARALMVPWPEGRLSVARTQDPNAA